MKFWIANQRKPVAHANSWVQRWLACHDLSKQHPGLAPPTPQHQYHYANLSVSTQFIFQFPAGWIPTMSVCHLSFHCFHSFCLFSQKALMSALWGSYLCVLPKMDKLPCRIFYILPLGEDRNKEPNTIYKWADPDVGNETTLVFIPNSNVRNGTEVAF